MECYARADLSMKIGQCNLVPRPFLTSSKESIYKHKFHHGSRKGQCTFFLGLQIVKNPIKELGHGISENTSIMLILKWNMLSTSTEKLYSESSLP